jgi:diguanylate cyclase (GGDEF)-like protein
MTGLGPNDPSRPLSSRRLLLPPAVLLLLLAGLPWVMEYLEAWWIPLPLAHLREVVDTGITLVLGAWLVTLIHREHRVARLHLEELERLSLTDPLTGLGNRRAFERDLELRLSRSRRLGEPLALLYMDVEGLKRLYDRFGHASGDETLRCLASVLRSSSRLGTDTAYRVGGDEFVMVLSADRAGAEAIAGRIALSFPERSQYGTKVSLGVVVWDAQASVADLLDEADSRMYRDKHMRPARRAETNGHVEAEPLWHAAEAVDPDFADELCGEARPREWNQPASPGVPVHWDWPWANSARPHIEVVHHKAGPGMAPTPNGSTHRNGFGGLGHANGHAPAG